MGDFLKCVIEAAAVVVKSARLQSDGLAVQRSCSEALDKFPQITRLLISWDDQVTLTRLEGLKEDGV